MRDKSKRLAYIDNVRANGEKGYGLYFRKDVQEKVLKLEYDGGETATHVCYRVATPNMAMIHLAKYVNKAIKSGFTEE
jgi:hypothetical protein